MWVPYQKKKMIKRSKLRGETEGLRERGGEGENFSVFILLVFFLRFPSF